MRTWESFKILDSDVILDTSRVLQTYVAIAKFFFTYFLTCLDDSNIYCKD